MDIQQAGDRLAAIVEGMYASLLDDAELTASVAQIGELVGAAHGGILCWSGDANDVPTPVAAFTSEPDRFERFLSSYTTEFHSLDPCKPIWGGIADADWYVDTLRQPPRERAMSPYYREFFRPHGMGGFATMKIAADRIWALSLERDQDRPDFCATQLQQISTITPHLRCALQLRDKLHELRTLAAASLGVLEQLAVPLWIVDEKGCIRFANRCAAGLMGRPGCVPTARGQRLQLATAGEQSRYEKLLRQAFSPTMRVAGAMAAYADAQARYILQIVPLPANARWADDWQRPLALIVCHSRGRQPPGLGALLGALYGFTAAETRIAAALLDDRTLDEIAGQGQVKVSTVRMQVKSMLAKSGCRRQAELVRLCAGLVLIDPLE